jgi:WD40 repeat protein
MCFSTETGQRLSGYQLGASCTCLAFDEASSFAFVGDTSGQITVIKVSSNSAEKITTVKKHTGTVQCLTFDSTRHLLYSGSHDRSVVVWDIKSPNFTTFELHGHENRVRNVLFCRGSNRLLSAGDDSMIVCWSLDAKREPPVKWHESDECEKCSSPFFWNLKLMWDAKTIGGRQHHCRNCGKALCAKCAANTTTIPNVGHECLVRVCDDCRLRLDDEQQASLATFHDVHHSVTAMHLDETKKLLLTVGKDRLIKLWDASSILQ